MRSEYVVRQSLTSSVQARLDWFTEYQILGNAKATCAQFGISRKTFYKWLKRFRSSGGDANSLADLPRTPHHSPRRTSDEIRAIVIDLRHETGFGPRRIGKVLWEEREIRLSERTIWKIIRSSSEQPKSVDIQHSRLPLPIDERTSIAA